MKVVRLQFPTTAAGRRALRDSIRVDGVRENYPDGSKLEDVDWDQVAAFVDQYMQASGRSTK